MTPENKDRWVHVSWADAESESFTTTLEADSVDRDGLVLDMATVLSSMKLKVRELSARSLSAGKAIVTMTFDVHDLDELSAVRQKIGAVPGISHIRRGHN